MTRMVIRILAAFASSGAICLLAPALVLSPAAHAAAAISRAVSPYIGAACARVEGSVILIEGEVHVEVTRADGYPLESAPGRWRKSGLPSMSLLVVALSVWAAPSMSASSRFRRLPVVLVLAFLAAALDLAIEIEFTALDGIGRLWLPSIPLEDTPSNRAALGALESRYNLMQAAREMAEAGARLAAGACAGLAAVATAPRNKLVSIV